MNKNHVKSFISLILCLSLLCVTFSVLGEENTWTCPECGRKNNTGNFCGFCAHPSPPPESEPVEAPTEDSSESQEEEILPSIIVLSEKCPASDAHLRNNQDEGYYSITWQDDTGKTIDITTVEYGEKPTHADPKKEADQQYVYTFSGWQPHLENVTGDATYKATFRKMARTYTVTWLDESGKLIDTTSVAYGYKPTHKEPTKESDQQYTYTFSGWQPDVEKVTIDATYKATFKKEKRLNTGDIITFGHYEQDNNMKNGPEPIEWIVLDAQDGRYMVISKYILDAGNHWWSKIDEWLNDVFPNTAFTVEEQSKIIEIEIKYGPEQEYGAWLHYPSYFQNERGKVFLLSYAEALKYLGVTKEKSVYSRSSPTEYAVSRGAYVSDFNKTEEGKNSGWWWLRSYGSHSDESYATVNSNGSLDESVRENTHGGIRPAI